jgi:hypothetical protein
MRDLADKNEIGIDRTVRSIGIDIAHSIPHIKIELNGSVKICLSFLFLRVQVAAAKART